RYQDFTFIRKINHILVDFVQSLMSAVGHYGQYDNYFDRNALLLKAAGVKNRTFAVHPSWCVASGVYRGEVWTKCKQIYKHAGLGC
ncbi:MAG: hypothetical protein AAFR90_14135, partial [Pseudomonadota bacterium]